MCHGQGWVADDNEVGTPNKLIGIYLYLPRPSRQLWLLAADTPASPWLTFNASVVAFNLSATPSLRSGYSVAVTSAKWVPRTSFR